MSTQPISERLVSSWERQYEVASRPVFYETDAIRERILGDIEPLRAEHERLFNTYLGYIEDNPWAHFNHDRDSAVVRLRRHSEMSSASYLEYHKVYGQPVPVVDERSRINPSILVQPYMKREYNTREKDYVKEVKVLGWQVIERPANDDTHPKPPKILTHKTFEKVNGLLQFIDRKPVSTDIEKRLMYQAKLLEFERIQLPTIHRELGEHAAVLELIKRGASALESLGVSAPKIGNIALAEQS
ncbi:MAG: hypothetical protein U5L95_00515 [Candidatus Saccharibacteria bacterium]|nr:hypothetical protein [Candidatus Saccharibacteria bacterium]